MTVPPPGAPGNYYGPTPGAPPGVPPNRNTAGTPVSAQQGKPTAALATVSVVLAAAALVVAVVSVTRVPTSAASQSVSSSPTPSTDSPSPEDHSSADRALCTAIAPLMAENNRINNEYAHLGDAGTPARDAATPKFISDTQDWVARVQPVVDEHPGADPFFRRTLQRFIDDQTLIVADLQPGPLTSFAKSLWSDSTGAYSGPLHSCENLGIKW